MKTLLLASALLASTPALSQDSWELAIGINTTHLSSRTFTVTHVLSGRTHTEVVNEDNKLVQAIYRPSNSNLYYSLASFKNSYYRGSHALSVGYTLYDAGSFKFEVEAGIYSGYQRTEIPHAPTIGKFHIGFVPKLSVDLLEIGGTHVRMNYQLLGSALATTISFETKF